MQNRVLNIGYVTGLDYKDPLIDPHAEFQRYKTHPYIARLLEGGKMIRYGAKTIAAGGYFAMPRMYADGVLLVGDCAGFLNAQRLKGIHSAIKSGMLAAEVIFEALKARRLFGEAVAALRASSERKLDHSGVAQGEKLSRRLQTRSLARADQYRFAVFHRRSRLGYLRSRPGASPATKR